MKNVKIMYLIINNTYIYLYYIMSQKHFTPKTILEVEQQYAQVDINHLIEDDFDINNSILADEHMELEQEQEYWDNRQIEEYQDAMQFAMEQIKEE